MSVKKAILTLFEDEATNASFIFPKALGWFYHSVEQQQNPMESNAWLKWRFEGFVNNEL